MKSRPGHFDPSHAAPLRAPARICTALLCSMVPYTMMGYLRTRGEILRNTCFLGSEKAPRIFAKHCTSNNYLSKNRQHAFSGGYLAVVFFGVYLLLWGVFFLWHPGSRKSGFSCRVPGLLKTYPPYGSKYYLTIPQNPSILTKISRNFTKFLSFLIFARLCLSMYFAFYSNYT